MASAVDLGLFGPRVRDENHKSPYWACHRHVSKVGLFVHTGKSAPSTICGFRVLPCYKGIKWVLRALLSVTRVYTLCGFINHRMGEPTTCWWTTDTNVLDVAMGMQQTLCPWLYLRSSTDWKAAHDELFHRCQGLLLDYCGRYVLSPDSSLSHLDYGSSRYGTRYIAFWCGTCYIIAEQC